MKTLPASAPSKELVTALSAFRGVVIKDFLSQSVLQAQALGFEPLLELETDKWTGQ